MCPTWPSYPGKDNILRCWWSGSCMHPPSLLLHDIGDSSLSCFPIDMVKLFPLDYVHSVFSGTSHKFLNAWFKSGCGHLRPQAALSSINSETGLAKHTRAYHVTSRYPRRKKGKGPLIYFIGILPAELVWSNMNGETFHTFRKPHYGSLTAFSEMIHLHTLMGLDFEVVCLTITNSLYRAVNAHFVSISGSQTILTVINTMKWLNQILAL